MTMWTPELADSTRPLYLTIADRLAAGVARGELAAGERLPTHRALARRLGVTVGTVSRAYAEAERRGLVRGEVGRGTYVAGGGDSGDLEPFARPEIQRDGFVELGLNLPAPLPEGEDSRALAAACRQLAGDPEVGRWLAYQDHAGAPEHRRAGAEWTRRAGFEVDADRVLVTHGSQHALTVALTSLARPGESILTESLTYPGIRALANLLDLRLEGVATDGEGILPEALAEACRARRSKILYLVPTIHNPTGVVMPVERRQAIAELARELDLTLIEDDVYCRLLADPLPPLASFAPERTYYISNTSKSIAPGLRIGYLVAPAGDVGRLTAGLWSITWMAAPLLAEIARRWIADGTAERLLAARRREAMERQRMAAELLRGFRFDAHPHGYHLWLHMPDPWCADELTLLARKRGVGVTAPGAFVAGRGAVPHAVRLCLGAAADRASLRRALTTVVEILSEAPAPTVCIA